MNSLMQKELNRLANLEMELLDKNESMSPKDSKKLESLLNIWNEEQIKIENAAFKNQISNYVDCN